MWSNFLRFVGDGVTVGGLPPAAGLPKVRMLSTLGGMERWRYVFVGPASADEPPKAKRDGWGSVRGLRGEWVVRPTPAGRKAEEIWRPLFGDIEQRWEERFGADAIDELRRSLARIIEKGDVELPEYVPIVSSTDGIVAGLSPRERDGTAVGGLHLSALLSQVLLLYTIDFELESKLSLPLTENFVRVLDETGVTVRNLPLVAAVSNEATSMALKFLAKTGYVVVEGERLRQDEAGPPDAEGSRRAERLAPAACRGREPLGDAARRSRRPPATRLAAAPAPRARRGARADRSRTAAAPWWLARD
jgi:hypothetical protein